MNDNDSLLIEANPTSPVTDQTKVFINTPNNSNKKKIFGSVFVVFLLLIGLFVALQSLPEKKITKKEAAFPSCVKSTRQADYGQTTDTVKITPKEQTEENGNWKLTWALTGAKPNEHFTGEIKIYKCHSPYDTSNDQCNAGDPNSEEITKTISFDAPASVTATTEIPFSVEESVTCCEKDQADLVSFNGNPWGSSFFIRVAGQTDVCAQTTPSPTPTTTPTVSPTVTPTVTPTITPTIPPTGTPTPTTTSTPAPKIGCYQGCNSDDDCNGTMRCQTVDNVKKCVNPTCPGENDCLCNQSCWQVCGQNSECPSNLSCKAIDGTSRCVNPSCERTQNCTCQVTTPTPTGEQLPKVGSILPTTGIIAGGALLILLSFMLAL